jgi:hypothetical protein
MSGTLSGLEIPAHLPTPWLPLWMYIVAVSAYGQRETLPLEMVRGARDVRRSDA